MNSHKPLPPHESFKSDEYLEYLDKQTPTKIIFRDGRVIRTSVYAMGKHLGR